jgi:murein DD-endopeptidase MepM/ murein hydrolase activator NlpD
MWGCGKFPDFASIGFQNTDQPLAMPEKGEIDDRFQFPSVWQVAQIPESPRFDPPMGTENGGMVYNAQKFRDMNEKRGGPHSGDDLNGIGGMDTDLGDPVYSPADGLVLFAGEPSPGWGKTLVIAHKTSDGRTLHSMMAHLNRIDVPRGALVPRGGKIGTVGTSNGFYPAHLHFEMRASHEVDIGAGYGTAVLNRLDPMATVASLRNSKPDALSPSPLTLALRNGGDSWTTLEIEGADKSPLLRKEK